jgi:hypothetical protein
LRRWNREAIGPSDRGFDFDKRGSGWAADGFDPSIKIGRIIRLRRGAGNSKQQKCECNDGSHAHPSEERIATAREAPLEH